MSRISTYSYRGRAVSSNLTLESLQVFQKVCNVGSAAASFFSEKTGEAVLVCSSERENEFESLSQPAPENSRWNFLALDLQAMVFELFRSHYYAHVKTVKLCANMTVKGDVHAYTSDIRYFPETHIGDWNPVSSD